MKYKKYIVAFLLMMSLGLLVGYVYRNQESLKRRFVGVRITDVTYQKLSPSSVRVSFKTSAPVSAKLIYGTTELYGVETSESAVSKEHSILLNGLLPGKDHNFKVVIKDEKGGVKESDNYLIKAN